MKFLFDFWPQLFILTMIVLGFLKSYFFSGQERMVVLTSGLKINIIVKLIFLNFVLSVGGFFENIGGAQIIYLILFAFVTFVAVHIIFFQESGKEFKSRISSVGLADFINLFLFYWGGFFDELIQYLNQ